jgi:FkbM family methyltransferase
VLAIEPVPRTFAMLEANVTANDLGHLITCSCSAIASDRGAVKMWTGFGSGQAELAIEGHRPAIDYWGDRGQLVDVAAAPLDEIVARHDLDPADVALVWADIQGAEAELVLTAESLWAAGVPLYLEVYPAGLELHGGLAHFTRAVTSRFATFRAKGSDEDVPITRFEEWVAGIDPDWYTDALLIP